MSKNNWSASEISSTQTNTLSQEDEMRLQKFTVLVGLIVGVLLFGAVAQATTLTFDGNICGGGTSCTNGESIDQSYGDIPGQLDVIYTSRLSNGNTASDYNFLKWWDADYNDLTHVAWGGQNDSAGVPEIAFIPSPGFVVDFNGFDLGAWPDTTRGTQFTIYDTGYNALIGSTAITVGTGPVPNGHSTFPMGFGSTTGFILQWGPSGYNVGIDNISFDVRPTGIPVPEPSSMLFLATGLAGILGYGWRRTRGASDQSEPVGKTSPGSLV